MLNPCTALSKAPAPEPAYNTSTNRTTNRTQVSNNFPKAEAQRPHESRSRVTTSGGIACYHGGGVVQDGGDGPVPLSLRAEYKNRSETLPRKRLEESGEERTGTGERRTAVGLRRERHRGHRGEPRPGLMVGSRWRCAPLRSFSSYTSRVPMPIAGEGCAAAAAPARGSLLGCGLGCGLWTRQLPLDRGAWRLWKKNVCDGARPHTPAQKFVLSADTHT